MGKKSWGFIHYLRSAWGAIVLGQPELTDYESYFWAAALAVPKPRPSTEWLATGYQKREDAKEHDADNLAIDPEAGEGNT